MNQDYKIYKIKLTGKCLAKYRAKNVFGGNVIILTFLDYRSVFTLMKILGNW